VLLTYIMVMVNTSLLESSLPESAKHAIITPIPKKQSARDARELKNHRPVSNETFISKVIVRVVVEQLIKYLHENGLLPLLQSAYRHSHSTEIVLLRVLSDIIAAADCQEVTLLSLLDLSIAFDCVDHDILISRLQNSFGICGSVLSWLESFLTDRTQQVCYGATLSAVVQLCFGIPQGSVLGPLLFLLYTAELFDVIASSGLVGHSYADDTQAYISAAAKSADIVVDCFISCVERIEAWISSNCLKMNADKTQIIWLGT